jgi:hypothetical protein
LIGKGPKDSSANPNNSSLNDLEIIAKII